MVVGFNHSYPYSKYPTVPLLLEYYHLLYPIVGNGFYRGVVTSRDGVVYGSSGI